MSQDEIILNIPDIIRNRYQSKGNLLWIAYDCLLIEKENRCSYRYDALNIRTGASVRLVTRKMAVNPGCYDNILDKIKNCDVAGYSRFNIDENSNGHMTKEDLLDTLNYIFHTLLPKHGYPVRDGQVSLAEHILECFKDRKISLSEAEVGTGKTLAYLAAATVMKRSKVNNFFLQSQYFDVIPNTDMPIVISTSSIALQTAIISEYLPALSDILMTENIIREPLTAVLRKGKEHYVCMMRLEAFLKSKPHHKAVPTLKHLKNRKAPIDLDKIDTLNPFVKHEVCVKGSCDKQCKYYKECRYRNLMSYVRSGKHDFQICNHNYMLADISHRAEHKEPLIPAYQGIIIDEAHKLLETARQMHEISITKDGCLEIADTLDRMRLETGCSEKNFKKRASQFRAETENLFALLERDISLREIQNERERFSVPLNDKAGGSLVKLRCYIDGITEELTENKVQDRFYWSRDKVLFKLADLREKICTFKLNRKLIYWLQNPGEHQELHGIPKDLPKLLHDKLWNKRLPIVLTSGTLSAGGSFDRIKDQLGLNYSSRVTEICKQSPFDHKNKSMLYLSPHTLYPDNHNPDYIESIADEIENLVHAARGHTVVLFTSYKAMELTYKRIEEKHMGYPLFMMSRGNLSALEHYKKSGNGVLFAAGNMWEGIDIPGDILSSLIIVRLPFAVPDTIAEWEQKKYTTLKDYKRWVVIPDMLIKLRQAVGRLLRSMGDSGAISILDIRVENGAYLKPVLEALPKCPVTSDVRDVEEFIHSVKDDTYFECCAA